MADGTSETPILDLLAKMNRRDHPRPLPQGNADVPTHPTAETPLA